MSVPIAWRLTHSRFLLKTDERNIPLDTKGARFCMMAGNLYAREILGTDNLTIRFRTDCVEYVRDREPDEACP